MVTIRDALAAAVGHHQAGRLLDARPAYLSILRALPGHPDALHLLGVLESQLGRPHHAVPLLRRAVALLPGDADYTANLARALRAAEQPEEAARAFAHALRLDPEQPEAAWSLGNLLLAGGERVGAARCYRHTLALNPAHANVLHNLAVLALERAGLDRPILNGRVLDPALVARAFRELGRVLAVQPGHADAGDALIATALKMVQGGQADAEVLDRAARAAPAALRRNPRDSRAAAVVAYRLYRRGRTDLASRLMERFARRFSAAEIAADFELRLWSMVHAERGFVDGLPAADALVGGFARLETVFEVPAGDGPMLAVSCDDGYYRRFVGALLASVEGQETRPAVWVHVVNPSAETEADLAAWRGRLPLGFSRERVDFTGWDDHRRTTYYACIRFLRWHQLLGRLGRPLVHVDADCTVEADFGALAAMMATADVGLLRDPRGRGPTREITVCFAWFQPTERGRAYLDRTAAYIAHFLRRGQGYWMLDQAAPFCALERLVRRGEGPEVRWFDFLDFPWIRFIGEK